MSSNKGISSLVSNLISDNPILIASKSYCPYCKKAKTIFDSLNKQYKAIELDQIDNGDQIQAYLKELTNQGTVPNIFIHKKHIGGCSDLEALHQSGELAKILGAF